MTAFLGLSQSVKNNAYVIPILKHSSFFFQVGLRNLRNYYDPLNLSSLLNDQLTLTS